MKVFTIILILSMIAFSLYADSWEFSKKRTKTVEEYGETKIEVVVDATEDQHWPMFELAIYKKEKLLAKYRDVGYEDFFASKDNTFFLGVSNCGVPGTAYVIFDNKGRLIREVKHAYSELKYSSQSVTIEKVWYNKSNPEVSFTHNGGFLEVHINTSSGSRINLLEKR